MSKKIPQISDAESSVMKVLWENGQCTSAQIVGEVSKESDWKPKTIQTLITRLVAKGAIKAEKLTGKAFVYSALVSKDEYIRDANNSFLQKMYDGSLSLMLASFVKERSLSKEQIESLKNILEGDEK
ncbi:MAG: Penicillinase repressor [Firmicutes bacterium ADurb.Bin193]|nr:MAG: Penicillinase repressor [Firmicutes bacterium ADurb.Bin193]